jgi:hypothetical protein
MVLIPTAICIKYQRYVYTDYDMAPEVRRYGRSRDAGRLSVRCTRPDQNLPASAAPVMATRQQGRQFV